MRDHAQALTSALGQALALLWVVLHAVLLSQGACGWNAGAVLAWRWCERVHGDGCSEERQCDVGGANEIVKTEIESICSALSRMTRKVTEK